MVEVELKRVVDGSHSRGVDRDGEQVTLPLNQLLGDESITFVVLLTPLIEGKNLRTNDSSGDSTHTKTVVGNLVGQISKDFGSWDGSVLRGKSFVCSSVDGTLGGNLGIISDEESTLSTVDHFVTLGTDGSNLTDVSRVGSLPFNSKRVSTILEEDNIVAIAGILDGIHIGKLSTHVRDEAVFDVGVFNKLLLEILDVHAVVVIRFNVDGLSSGMLNSTRNSSKSKGVTQHLITRL
mmetsp:Transcript_5214/g.7547  ORF Transcript_5214/g.7547 Transcript_5214/m.7547 type:complete len:236 (-) Transcript_5214:405-1112(-)